MLYFREKKSNRKHYIRIFVIILIIIVSSLSKSNSNYSSKIANVIMTPFSEFASFVNRISVNTFEFFFGSISDRENLKKLSIENQDLRKKVNDLELVVNSSDYLKQTYLFNSEVKGISASIIMLDPDNYTQRFTLNKGSIDNVKLGDIVLSAYNNDIENISGALLGKVVEVGLNYSVVSSIFDETYNISFIHSKSNITGIINERSDNLLSGFLLKKENVSIGDKVFTSGNGGRYSKGLFIGEIVDTKESDDKLQNIIKIKSPIDMTKVYDVTIIKEK